MNLMLKIAMLSCAGLSAIGTAGCKVTECTETAPDGGTTKKENCVQFEPTVEYRDARMRFGGLAWRTGRSVSITNPNGPLKVALDNPAEERVKFLGIAFTRETNNAEGAQKAKDRLGGMADPSFSGVDEIKLDAPGGGVDGYDLTVWIPPEFDATLKVVNENGTTTLYGADGTTSTTVLSHKIDASNLKRKVDLHAKVGDIIARGVPSGPGNVIVAEVGDIAVQLGAANLAITAKTDLGVVAFPDGWTPMVATDKKSGNATLGDGSGALNVESGNGDISFSAQ